MKVNLYWSDNHKLAVDSENVHLFEEEYHYEVDLETVREFEELKQRSKDLQKKLYAIYTAKNG
jgi:hypothetical protein